MWVMGCNGDLFSVNGEAFSLEVQQDLAKYLPGICGVSPSRQIAAIVSSNDKPLMRPSPSPSPTRGSSSGTGGGSGSDGKGGFPLMYVIAAGCGGVVVTGVASLLIWRYRRNRKHLRRKVSV